MELAEALLKIERLEAQLAAALARIEELERRLGESSRNSNKPPSSDPPWHSGGSSAPGPRKRRHGRRGMWRKLVDESEVDRIEHVVPHRCRSCHGELSGEPCGEAERHQVVELPAVRAQVTEYRLEARRCRRCFTVTRAEPPDGVGRTPFGPRLLATVAMLSGGYRLSKRNIQSLLETMWGARLSLGGISAIEARMGQALRGPYDGACGHVKRAPVVYADETPWKERHRLRWLWTAGTKDVVTFRIDHSRSADAAKALLSEDFAGLLVSDRYSGYGFVPWERRQVCWAHLQREFVAFSESPEPVMRYVGMQGLHHLQTMFELEQKRRAGALDPSPFLRAIEPVCERIEALLDLGARASHLQTRAKCRSILKSREAFFRFLRGRGVEPTNNRSERALRHGVLYRKVSLGTQSDRGSRFVERMLTVVHTLRAQGRNLFGYLLEVAGALLAHAEPPSLLPVHA